MSRSDLPAAVGLQIARWRSYIMFAVAMATIMLVGYGNDYDSCVRGQSVRSGLNAAADYFQAQEQRARARAQIDPSPAAALDLKAAEAANRAARDLHIHQLDCSFVPSTR